MDINQIRDHNLIVYTPVELRGGEKSDYYVDIKQGLGNPELLREIVSEMSMQLPTNATAIAASGYGGLPIAAALSVETGLPAAYVRDSEKGHGLGGFIDGYKPVETDRIVVVDDVYTSGSSLRQTISRLAHGEVISCHVVYRRSNNEFEYPLHWLLDYFAQE